MLILKKENLKNWTSKTIKKRYRFKITQFIAKLYYKKKGYEVIEVKNERINI